MLWENAEAIFKNPRLRYGEGGFVGCLASSHTADGKLLLVDDFLGSVLVFLLDEKDFNADFLRYQVAKAQNDFSMEVFSHRQWLVSRIMQRHVEYFNAVPVAPHFLFPFRQFFYRMVIIIRN